MCTEELSYKDLFLCFQNNTHSLLQRIVSKISLSKKKKKQHTKTTQQKIKKPQQDPKTPINHTPYFKYPRALVAQDLMLIILLFWAVSLVSIFISLLLVGGLKK